MKETVSLYETLGGKDTMNAVVDAFYERILADERINHYFRHTDMTRQRKHQGAFISMALGGPKDYTGRGMEKAHQGLNLTDADFAAVAENLLETLESFNVAEIHIDTILGTVAQLKPSIVHQ